jgi:hypothetical protein
MPIAANNVQFFKAQVNDDTPINGGLISNTLIADGVKNNIFPDASKNERLNGSTKYRKVFLGLRNPDNTAAIDVKLFVLRPTQAQDAVVMVEATSDSTQDDIISSNRRWGAGSLFAAASVGSTTITVTPEQAVHDVFKVGDTIAITTRNENNASDPIDYYTIDAISNSGSNKTITLNRTISTAIPVGAIVTSCVYLDGLGSVVETPQVLSGAGVYDFSKIVTNNAGSVEDDWRVVFTGTTSFDIFQGSLGYTTPVATGSISAALSPLNPVNNQPYFRLETGVFSGGYSVGDAFSFSTTAANLPIFLERIIPAGTSYEAGNSVLLAVELESA